MPQTERPSLQIDLKVTPTAAEQVRGFMDATPDLPEDTAGLRVSVTPGGCSGFKYSLNLEDKPLDDDVVMDVEGVRLFVDMFSAQYLDGTTINYVATMTESGFTFENPNATGGCGCGSSFSA